MLATVLAGLLGLGSVIFYMAAFVYPEVHRRSDFLWSGLGLLYAAVLWFSSAQMTGLVLLGQVVAVALLLGLGWQTLTVRRQKTPVYQQTPIVLTPEIVGGWAKSKLNDLRIAPDETIRAVRLERRAAGDPAMIDRLDPRRRPAYDYEFVEDGVAKIQQEAQQGELFTFSAEPSTEKGATLPIAEVGAEADSQTEIELAYTAPPSAEAEVVAVEKAEAEKAEVEKAEVEQANETADVEESDAARAVLEAGEGASTEAGSAAIISEKLFEATSSEAGIAKVGIAESENVETGAAEAKAAEVEVVEVEITKLEPPAEKAAKKDSAIANDDANDDAKPDDLMDEESTPLAIAEDDLLDDWEIAESGDQLYNPLNKVSEESKEVKQDIPDRYSSTSKPSLLEMPVIFVIWVKDVVVSLIKPKPSKPVIEIPRREPVVDSAAVNEAVTNNLRYNSEPEPDKSKREVSEDSLEESNWID